jgi:hypothetical protein
MSGFGGQEAKKVLLLGCLYGGGFQGASALLGWRRSALASHIAAWKAAASWQHVLPALSRATAPVCGCKAPPLASPLAPLPQTKHAYTCPTTTTTTTTLASAHRY